MAFPARTSATKSTQFVNRKKKEKMKAKKLEIPKTEDFQNLIDLLACYTEADNRGSELEASINKQLMECIDEVRSDYTKIQEVLTKSEAALEIIARKHPEWFSDKRTIKTLYGQVKLTSTSKVEVANQELSVVLIELEIDKAKRGEESLLPLETLQSLIRQETSLNKEALEKLDETVLAKFRLKRIKDESFSVKPAKIDLGKAVKEEVEQQEAA
jgi:hypothetical protein